MIAEITNLNRKDARHMRSRNKESNKGNENKQGFQRRWHSNGNAKRMRQKSHRISKDHFQPVSVKYHNNGKMIKIYKNSKKSYNK